MSSYSYSVNSIGEGDARQNYIEKNYFIVKKLEEIEKW